MKTILPDRETAQRRGWIWQVQWIDQFNVCFVRCKSRGEADTHMDRLTRDGLQPVLIDLRDALQLR